MRLSMSTTTHKQGNKTAKSVTPAMRQYHEIKRLAADSILFFRMGDFYEMFYEDAINAARTLGLTLTSRQKDSSGSEIPMCGIPYHAADNYIGKLIRSDIKVAICEQVEDAKQAKGIVKREIVRVITPSTYLHQGYLEASETSYLIVISPEDDALGVALVDISTGDFLVLELKGAQRWQNISEVFCMYQPREVLHPEGFSLSKKLSQILGPNKIPLITKYNKKHFDKQAGRDHLLNQFGTASLNNFGLEHKTLGVAAASAALRYLEETQRGALTHISKIRCIEEASYLVLDSITQQNLELTTSFTEGGRTGSLLHVLDRTATAMGARSLVRWILRPLVDLEIIGKRLDSVEELAFDIISRAKIRDVLKDIHDLERLLSRISLKSSGPRDFIGLANSLSKIPALRALTKTCHASLLQELDSALDPVEPARDDIETTLISDPPLTIKDGGVIREKVSGELDELRKLRAKGKATLTEIESRERKRTGITSLKIRFNKVFGYYIEISKTKLDAVPEDYIRKQTLVSAERFITPELKDYEEKILGAEDRIRVLEQSIFKELQERIKTFCVRIQATATAVASLDVLTCLADIAATENFTKPRLHTDFDLDITDGRHPVIESTNSEPFVTNDLHLDEQQHLVILTGPNMGGKSTYLRQSALIVLLAQMGSFVPAKSAKLPIVDRIFTRVGASDNLYRGRSTFMVEMEETAHILRHATRNSLILLDEVGRGTATYDGLSLAWSVAEHIAVEQRLRTKTIFATHYHELTELASELPAVKNLHVSAREWKDDIVFLRKVLEGGSDRSYGIQVAKLAGLPSGLIERAKQILLHLEKTEFDLEGRPRIATQQTAEHSARQMSLFAGVEDRIVSEIERLDTNELTPLDALKILVELQERLNTLKNST